MPETLRIALFGAAGRMGRQILFQAQSYPGLKITHGYDPGGAAGYYGNLQIEPPPANLRNNPHLVIDFSVTSAVADNVKLAKHGSAAYLCGVTGLEKATMDVLHDSASSIAVLCAPNMSPGMNLLFMLAATAASALPDYERRIVETHHARKVDAPSGSALRLAYAVDQAVGGKTRIDSMRMGDVIGEHRIVFGGPGERIEILHRADDRSVFATGTLRAAEWLSRQKPGFYTMADVLGLTHTA